MSGEGGEWESALIGQCVVSLTTQSMYTSWSFEGTQLRHISARYIKLALHRAFICFIHRRGYHQSFAQPGFHAEHKMGSIWYIFPVLTARKALKKPAPNPGTCVSLIRAAQSHTF